MGDKRPRKTGKGSTNVLGGRKGKRRGGHLDIKSPRFKEGGGRIRESQNLMSECCGGKVRLKRKEKHLSGRKSGLGEAKNVQSYTGSGRIRNVN